MVAFGYVFVDTYDKTTKAKAKVCWAVNQAYEHQRGVGKVEWSLVFWYCQCLCLCLVLRHHKTKRINSCSKPPHIHWCGRRWRAWPFPGFSSIAPSLQHTTSFGNTKVYLSVDGPPQLSVSVRAANNCFCDVWGFCQRQPSAVCAPICVCQFFGCGQPQSGIAHLFSFAHLHMQSARLYLMLSTFLPMYYNIACRHNPDHCPSRRPFRDRRYGFHCPATGLANNHDTNSKWKSKWVSGQASERRLIVSTHWLSILKFCDVNWRWHCTTGYDPV